MTKIKKLQSDKSKPRAAAAVVTFKFCNFAKKVLKLAVITAFPCIMMTRHRAVAAAAAP